MFEDEQFPAALVELETPRCDDFELFVAAGDINVYRKYDQASGLYEYKIHGIIDCECSTLKDVYVDFNYRCHWNAKYVKDAFEDELEGDAFIYWQSNWPFPMSNRDYTYVRAVREMDDNTWIALQKAHPVEKYPTKSGVVRVDDFRQSLVVQKAAPNRSKLFMYYFENPGGSIPTWLVNWAAKKGVPSFIDDMVKACAGYNDYLALKK